MSSWPVQRGWLHKCTARSLLRQRPAAPIPSACTCSSSSARQSTEGQFVSEVVHSGQASRGRRTRACASSGDGSNGSSAAARGPSSAIRPPPHAHLRGASASPSRSLDDELAPVCRLECDMESGLIAGASVRFFDSPSLRLRRRAQLVWEQGSPTRALIVKKPGVDAASLKLREIATWLGKQGVQVFVEAYVQQSEYLDLSPFTPGKTEVDFAITLGGDGTVLYLAALFQEDVPLPPVVCFAMGTLGFLTPFDANDFRACLARVLHANQSALYCTLRARKRCEIEDSGRMTRVHHVLNECVIDRGSFPGSVNLEIFIDGAWVTAAEADGLIIATPSGSTAYSMSAGGSMVAPSVPCTLITPLSPHSLSFRPLIIAESSTLTVRLPTHARSHARASFDSKHPIKIKRGNAIHFTTSVCPLPLINLGTLDTDWYEGITQKLKWNQLLRQPVSLQSSDAAEQEETAAAAVVKSSAALAQQQDNGSSSSTTQDGTASDESMAEMEEHTPFPEQSFYVQ